MFKNYGAIEFRATAVDSEKQNIEGPTNWSSFTCY